MIFNHAQMVDQTNEYFSFIEKLKAVSPKVEKVTSKNRSRIYNSTALEIHEHHIIPRHWFSNTPEHIAYCESNENKIFLTLADHIKAHELLYILYK